MRTIAAWAGAAGFLVAGCAKLPEHISEAYASDAYYQTLSCQELRRARASVARENRRLAAEQRTFVGILIPPRRASQIEQRIAAYKGELAAIERAERMEGCMTPPPEPEDVQPELPAEDAGQDLEEGPGW